jgi:NodT family efflux transporter outer membrane factor (OMF) lipoprotein
MRHLFFAVLLGGGSLSGCMPFGSSASLAPPGDLPERYTEPKASGRAGAEPEPASPPPAAAARQQQRGPWWDAFGDPALADLVEKSLSRNLDLRATRARVEQAEALADQAAAARLPKVNAQGQANWSRTPNAFVQGPADTTTLRASLPVSYEVDWFARHATQAKASQLDVQAADADVESAAMTLAAQVAEAWFDVLDARARQEVLTEQLRINETFLELTTLRFRQGLTSALDAHQQRQQVAATRAQFELIAARERVATNQLAVLLGDTPGGGVFAPERTTLPMPPDSVEAGVPADVIQNRPDVRAAARRLEAADKRVSAALAARLPSLVISAGAGYMWTRFDVPGSSPFGGTVHGPEFSAGALLDVPLFDGFQRRAQVNLERARVSEATSRYLRSVQQAVLEVQSALVQERHQREHILALEEQLQAARDSLESGRDQYRQGLSDFLPVLTALQAVQQTELALLGARRQLLSYRVQLHRALGGTWTRDLRSSRSDEPTR